MYTNEFCLRTHLSGSGYNMYNIHDITYDYFISLFQKDLFFYFIDNMFGMDCKDTSQVTKKYDKNVKIAKNI